MSTALSAKTIETVKATIPFLQENGLDLTKHFYKRLFEGNPEVKAFFNVSNQQSGAQQRALGGAICAFAQNIETPEVLAAAVSRIANKHAALGVKPEHYPIVGEHLLGSIDDLLNPAPPEILEAWGEAYGFLAGVLTQTEGDLYEEQESREHGWSGFQNLTVVRKQKESESITSFYLKAGEGKSLPIFQSGQYLTVRVPMPSSDDPTAPATTMRNYSLSGAPSWDHYRISVKQEVGDEVTPGGYVSNYLHQNVEVGAQLEIGPPCGDFYLGTHTEETPILLLSAGVGLTPVLSMLHSVENQPTTFLHVAQNSETHACRAEVEELVKSKDNLKLHFRYTAASHTDREQAACESEGYLDAEFLSSFLSENTEVYLCGPEVMMKSTLAILDSLGHPSSQIHYEYFGPE